MKQISTLENRISDILNEENEFFQTEKEEIPPLEKAPVNLVHRILNYSRSLEVHQQGENSILTVLN